MNRPEQKAMPDFRIDLEEIRRNFRQVAEEIDPNSPSMKEAREFRDQEDQRLAEKGIIVIL